MFWLQQALAHTNPPSPIIVFHFFEAKRKKKLMAENGSREMEVESDLKQQEQLQYVRLKIKCNKDGVERFYMIKRNSRMKTLLLEFCKLTSIDYRSTRFLINHRVFSTEKTPNQLGLDDDDHIDALIDGNGA